MIIGYFRPDHYYNNIFDVNLNELEREGIKGILCDIDNTIVPWKEKEVMIEVVEWLDNIQERGFRVCLLSNGMNSRVKFFSQKLDIPGIGKAVKPKIKAFKTAMNILKLEKDQIAIIGDQIFTDVLGGNRAGLKTILVDPMDSNEFITTRFFRLLENLFFKRENQEKME